MLCSRCIRLFSAYLDGELSARREARMTLHLRQCPRCREATADMRKADRLVSQILCRERRQDARTVAFDFRKSG